MRTILISLVLWLSLVGFGTSLHADSLGSACDELATHFTDLEDLLSYFSEFDTVSLSNEDQDMIETLCASLIKSGKWIRGYSQQKHDEHGGELASSLLNLSDEIPKKMRNGKLEEMIESMANCVIVLYELLLWCNDVELAEYEKSHPKKENKEKEK